MSKEKLKLNLKYKMEKNKADVCLISGLVYSTIQTIWRRRTKIISDFERNGSRMKQFREPERSDVDESLFKWLKHRISDDLPWTFLFFKFKF